MSDNDLSKMPLLSLSKSTPSIHSSNKYSSYSLVEEDS